MSKGNFEKVNGVETHYQWVGEKHHEKPVIIFLHEGLGSIPQWKDFPEILCKKTGCQNFIPSQFPMINLRLNTAFRKMKNIGAKPYKSSVFRSKFRSNVQFLESIYQLYLSPV